MVAFALLAEPGDDVGVEAEGELLFYWAVERVADGVLPELFGEFGEIGEVDGAIGALGELS